MSLPKPTNSSSINLPKVGRVLLLRPDGLE